MSQIMWIASYPRSGNTWMRVMLTNYLMNAPFSREETIDETVPDFHQILQGGMLNDLTKMGVAMASNNSVPILVKTHYLPSSAAMRQCGPMTSKVVYIVRNPRDVLLSSARYLGIVPSREESSREWARNFIAKRGYISWDDLTGTWSQNVSQWTSLSFLRQYFPDIQLLILRYEDIRSQPEGNLQQVVSFLGLDGATQLNRSRAAANNSSIEKMRALEEKIAASHGTGDHGNSVGGASRLGSSRWLVGQGLNNQSLEVFGQDIEAEYQQLIAADGEFSACAKQFGYAT